MNIIEAFNRLKENPNLDLVMKSKYFTIIYEPDKKAFYQLEYYERGDGLFDEEYSRIDLEENIFCLNDILADDWVIKHYRRSLTFVEAFKEVKNGKKLKRDFWKDDCYIDGYTKLIQLVEADLIANDWEVME